MEPLKQRGEAHLNNTDLNEQVHNFYQLDRFCNMYRTSKWKRGLSLGKDIKEVARQESKCSFAVVIDISEPNKDKLIETVESILKVDYKKQKIIVVLSTTKNLIHTEVLIEQLHRLIDDGIDSHLVIHENWSPQPTKDKDAFTEPMRNRQNYLIKISAGQTLDENFLSFIDMEVNKLLNMTVYFEDGEKNIFALAFGAVNKHYLDFLDYDIMSREIRKLSKDQKSYREYEKKE